MIEEVREILHKQGWDIVSKHEYMNRNSNKRCKGI